MTGALFSPIALERLAGSLLHFVWQGAAIAVLTALTLQVLKRRSAQSRYAVASVALLAMLMAPVVTFIFYAEMGALTSQLLRDVDRAASLAVSEATAPGIAVWTERIVLLWAVGVVVCLTRLLGGWLLSRSLVRSGSSVVAPMIVEAMRRARAGLHFHRPVRLLASMKVEAPVVIGWLRPVILLPASALTGLDAAQLLAILAHELAHIRRHDFLVNAIQRAVECVLFYHPAVWWVSGRIRVERERCCDDLAVRVCGDRLVYAEALIALEKARSIEPALAVSAAGAGVTDRVRRILGARGTNRDWPSALAAVVSVAILVGAGMWRPVSAEPAVAPAPQTTAAPPRAADQVETPAASPASPLNAIVAIATAQEAKPAPQPAPRPPAPAPPQVAQPTISAAREAAREKLGQLRVEYSADSFVKQAAEGDTIAVKLFLVAGMNINARDQEGFTALSKAAKMRQTETVQSLLAAGADPNLRAGSGSALSFAAENSDIATMKVLLLGGAAVNLKVGAIVEQETTALTVAAQRGHRDAAVLLLDNKADMEATGSWGTALRAAACNHRYDLVRLFVDRGANINAALNGSTALHCVAASPNRDLEVMRYLIDRGADVNAIETSSVRYTPLMRALYSRGSDEVRAGAANAAKLLIDRGADVNAQAADETTPLILAIQNQYADVVPALLAKGANPNAKNKRGYTPLTLAIDGPGTNVGIAMNLIDRGADVNMANQDGWTPLALAVSARNTDLGRALLSKGADPNAPAGNGQRLLSLASRNADIVKLLTEAGGKP
jgi:ankyrin repeat protein/beta-lactamase regulating signal transducer with metallopeptidase domain